MKQYLVRSLSIGTCIAAFAIGASAQDVKTETRVRRNDDIIIIKPKVNVDTKLSIEIKGSDVTVNGKPLADYKSDDVIISKRKQMNETGEVEDWEVPPPPPPPPATRFRRNGGTYSFGPPVMGYSSTNSNKAFLGVGTEKSENGNGVEIRSLTDESPADKAGLKEGDVITKINDTQIDSPEQLTKTIGKFKPEEKITVTYKRDKKEQKTTATLAKRKTDSIAFNTPDYQIFKDLNLDNNSFNFNFNKTRLGLKAQETEEGKGLKVLDVDDESAAAKAGIKEGDIITTFDGTEVNNIDKLREVSRPALDKGSFKVKLMRDGKQQEVEVKIPKNLKSTSL